eukprot:scaffold397469_cov26-Prasinocladus_malaysianus.AAC.1
MKKQVSKRSIDPQTSRDEPGGGEVSHRVLQLGPPGGRAAPPSSSKAQLGGLRGVAWGPSRWSSPGGGAEQRPRYHPSASPLGFLTVTALSLFIERGKHDTSIALCLGNVQWNILDEYVIAHFCFMRPFAMESSQFRWSHLQYIMV